jgi:hypothetical protein
MLPPHFDDTNLYVRDGNVADKWIMCCSFIVHAKSLLVF